ncbi:uncharacterized protein BBA_01688 [Beauveria bassiana ARSEF 2860]|uniref:Meiotically up-regulated gene 154 protein n=1 Tax=Beauveria bassiana (strain ARSEF 2860) TaxID=655819 RepID=J5JZC0_BEAB2|nr:uncharacterized protein BBA_01688 [Beauveria bassiana ARSEF 2860]EJP69723.1 hypothetical protein BBA_01688 [Beauveria bassiana ARSEF 2860]
MPRLVRRKPLLQRLSTLLNPMDFLLWLSEELETRDWDSENAGTQLGLGLNFLFLLARANSGSAPPTDDVFGSEDKSLWLSLIVNSIVWGLGIFAVTNGVYTMTRTRKYRMFEANINVQPGTPSARRVRVKGSPASSSPLRYLANMITPEGPESRSHPDKNRDVWELAVWDPLPISMRLFCLFGPAHVLVYSMFLPLASLDPCPSITVFNTLLLQVILSAQLVLFFSKFTQQGKDNSIIQKEVMHEYDTKFVHPLMHPVVRDVGIQVSTDAGTSTEDIIETGTPTTLIRRSFKTHKNPHIDEEESAPTRRSSIKQSGMKPSLLTPSGRRSDSFSPMPSIRSSGFRHSMATPGCLPASASTNNLDLPFSYTATGASTFERSPLKHAHSLNNLKSPLQQQSPRTSREMAAYEQRVRPSSPLKYPESRQSLGATTSDIRGTGTGRFVQHEHQRARW